MVRIMREAFAQPLCLMVNDSQLLNDDIVLCIVTILNSAQPTDFLPKEEVEKLAGEIGDKAREHGHEDPMAYFGEQVRSNLHIFILLSSLGQAFRVRLRQFPSIVSCCTADWTDKWPEDALYDVALINIEEEGLVQERLASLFVEVERTVQEASEQLEKEGGSRAYYTPKNYIDNLAFFNTKLSIQREDIIFLKKKMETGFNKMTEAKNTIKVLREKMEQLEPILIEKSEELDKIISKLSEEEKDVNQAKSVIEEERRYIEIKTDSVNENKAEADRILNEALPNLEKAQSALNLLTRQDLG